MKTSFFKWKPDLDSAASEYTKAGKRENSIRYMCDIMFSGNYRGGEIILIML